MRTPFASLRESHCFENEGPVGSIQLDCTNCFVNYERPSKKCLKNSKKKRTASCEDSSRVEKLLRSQRKHRSTSRGE